MAEEKDLPPIAEPYSKAREGLDKLTKFWRTKRAIARGEPLYDWSDEQLKQKNYFGPWTFNAIETAVTGAVASGAANLVRVVFSEPDETPPPLLPGEDAALAALIQRTSQWIDPFFIPILTTAIVFLAAWGSLRYRDSNSKSRARARRAYLYFDGAYGLFSQLFLALTLSIAMALGSTHTSRLADAAPVVVGLAVILAIVAFIYQYYINLRKIPKALFALNGYASRYPHFWNRRKPDDPPMNRWALSIIVGGTPLVLLTQLALGFVSLILAQALLWIQNLVR